MSDTPRPRCLRARGGAFGKVAESGGLRASGCQAGADALAWVGALPAAVWARYEFESVHLVVGLAPLLALAAVAAVLQLLVGLALCLYRGRYQVGGFDEALGVAISASLVALVLMTVQLVLPGGSSLPRSIVFLSAPLALLAMAATRYLRRLGWERSLRPGAGAEPVLVYGAGQHGVELVQSMLREPEGRYRPVALLDDDIAKAHLKVNGVEVVGGRDDLVEAAREHNARIVVVAMPDAPPKVLREVAERAGLAGLRMKVLPRLSELVEDRARGSDVRDVDEEDLMGRRPVNTNVAAIADFIAGRSVLVTGAGGSIGSELCRQVLPFGPSELIMLDRDESALHALQLSIHGRALLDTRDVVLADIRDEEAIRLIFAERRPEIVFHAAALKHLPMLEQYPEEAWKSNVLGTLNVIRAAAAADVETFVNISTDKAADPCSALGHSKRLAERLTAWMDRRASGTYLSVRFGNVLGSRGSVLHSFRAQIEAGGPLTVTHPDVTRFFMTIPEACQLVVQAAAIGGGGEALVLDMGEPVRIADVARRLVEQSGKDIEIVFTGLRPGEKMHELLIGDGERDERPRHPLISHVAVPPLNPADLGRATWPALRPRLAEAVALRRPA